MSNEGMRPRDLKVWAQEELADAVIERALELCAKHDTDADDDRVLREQAARVVKFLRQDAKLERLKRFKQSCGQCGSNDHTTANHVGAMLRAREAQARDKSQ
jgi:hypothetical protein